MEKIKKKAFNDVTEIAAYVPQVKVPGFSFPFLICDDEYVNPKLVGFTDPDEEGYDSHNLIFDVYTILEEKKDNSIRKREKSDIEKVFSTVRGFVDDDGARSSHNPLMQ